MFTRVVLLLLFYKDSATTIKIVALYVPEFRLSLLSVSQLAAQKYTTMFTSEFCLIHDDKKS
jgi:hypothetical protein